MNQRIWGQWAKALIGASMACGCGSRDAVWDTPISSSVGVASLRNAVVLLDSNLGRALTLTASPDQTIAVHSSTIGKPVLSTATSPDGSRFFALSAGQERLLPGSEGPALTVFDKDHLEDPRRYELPDALNAIALDPTGKLAIVYAGSPTGGAFITNPNELIFVDLSVAPGADAVHRRNLPSSSGGAPRRMTFTDPLHLPAGDRRLLLVETDRDVLLLDPDHLEFPEISLPVTDPHTDARALSPTGLAIDPGDPSTLRPPVIALRTDRDDSVILYTLGPSNNPPPANDFAPTPNTVYVGGVVSDMVFVDTAKGKRLAALVPGSTPVARLVDVTDNTILTAALGASYDAMTILSSPSGGSDRILLWSKKGQAGAVALWDLNKLPDAIYADIDTLKSIETLNLNAPVGSVLDVPEKTLKVLQTSSGSLYVLDTANRTTSPLNTSSYVTLRFAPQGSRAWVFERGQPRLAQVALEKPEVLPVAIDRQVDDVFEIDRMGGGRALIALHRTRPNDDGGQRGPGGDLGVTVFDADFPDATTSRRYSSLMLERLAP
jgi:hypothetical protein